MALIALSTDGSEEFQSTASALPGYTSTITTPKFLRKSMGMTLKSVLLHGACCITLLWTSAELDAVQKEGCFVVQYSYQATTGPKQ
jgi:hypothetical protein